VVAPEIKVGYGAGSHRISDALPGWATAPI